MDYVATSRDLTQTPAMVKSSIESSRLILSQIDPVELRLWVEQLTLVFSQRGNEVTSDATQWSAYVGRECDRLHQDGLHEKSIKLLGNVLSSWNFEPQTYEAFATSLDCLDHLVTNEVDALSDSLKWLGAGANELSNASVFALMHNSLATVFGGINKAANDLNDVEAAVTVSFGCTTFIDCLNNINEKCQKRV